MNKLLILTMLINLIIAIVFAFDGKVEAVCAHIQCLLWLDIIRKDDKLINKLIEYYKKEGK